MRGVTLLELLIVLALMAIVAGFVMPMFGGPVSTPNVTRVASDGLSYNRCSLER